MPQQPGPQRRLGQPLHQMGAAEIFQQRLQQPQQQTPGGGILQGVRLRPGEGQPGQPQFQPQLRRVGFGVAVQRRHPVERHARPPRQLQHIAHRPPHFLPHIRRADNAVNGGDGGGGGADSSINSGVNGMDGGGIAFNFRYIRRPRLGRRFVGLGERCSQILRRLVGFLFPGKPQQQTAAANAGFRQSAQQFPLAGRGVGRQMKDDGADVLLRRRRPPGAHCRRRRQRQLFRLVIIPRPFPELAVQRDGFGLQRPAVRQPIQAGGVQPGQVIESRRQRTVQRRMLRHPPQNRQLVPGGGGHGANHRQLHQRRQRTPALRRQRRPAQEFRQPRPRHKPHIQQPPPGPAAVAAIRVAAVIAAAPGIAANVVIAPAAVGQGAAQRNSGVLVGRDHRHRSQRIGGFRLIHQPPQPPPGRRAKSFQIDRNGSQLADSLLIRR